MYRFHGVSTKYLANYIYWLKWLQLFNTERDIIKSKNLMIHSNTAHIDTKIKDFKDRQPIYI